MTKSNKDIVFYNSSDIQKKIFTIRNVQVMLDSDLSKFYGVETKYLNRAVKRNSDRFPEEFMFQLTKEESDNLISQNATSDEDSLRSQNVILEKGRGKHRKYLPYVFTEQGVAMLSAVLKSETAKVVSRTSTAKSKIAETFPVADVLEATVNLKNGFSL